METQDEINSKRLKENKRLISETYNLGIGQINKLLEITSKILWNNNKTKVYFDVEIADELVEKGFLSKSGDYYMGNETTMIIWRIYNNVK